MRVFVGLSVVFALLIGGWFLLSGTTLKNLGFDAISPRLESLLGGAAQAVPAPPLREEYRNEAHRFSLEMPEGYVVQEFSDETTETVVLQGENAEGIQIIMTPFSEDLRVLTAKRVMEDIPDMRVNDIQEVEIGSDHKGIAFTSDNEAFNGASREVWFVFRGTLYQISTYAHLDPLLQAMFATWQFF